MKTAIVTGASRGIGKCIVEAFIKEKINVVLNYVDSPEVVEDLVKTMNENGGNVFPVYADISKFDEAQMLIKTAVEKFGSIDILVNNAGITRDNLLIKMSESDFDSVINVNLKGAFNCLKHVTPVMLKQKSGRIINISSVVGLTGNIGQVNYSASKAGIVGLTKSAARELASRNITVNAIAPGFISTPMTDVLPEKIKENIINSIPLKRFGEAEDIAQTVCFLASDSAKYITGQVIQVDGGMLM